MGFFLNRLQQFHLIGGNGGYCSRMPVTASPRSGRAEVMEIELSKALRRRSVS